MIPTGPAGNQKDPVPMPDFRRTLASLTACALAAALAAQAASAQEAAPPIAIELNKLEAREGSCRSLLLFNNPGETAFERFVLDIVAFDPDGVVNARVAVDAAPLAADKTVLKAFDLAGLPCDQVSRLLLNDVTDCQGTPAAEGPCVALVETTSRAGIDFIK